MSLEEAQELIMTARIQLGWVDPADLVTEDHWRAKRVRP